ncbi:MAG: hypothetical protein AB8B88_00925 [Devosiaceae bacterium]
MSSSTPNTPHNPNDEEPLDPRLEAVAVKMKRLSLVSSGIMFLGIFAVLGVILYRALAIPSTPDYPSNLSADEVRSLVVASVPGAQIVGTSVDERSLFVSAQSTDGAVVLEIDRATWQIVSSVRFTN